MSLLYIGFYYSHIKQTKDRTETSFQSKEPSIKQNDFYERLFYGNLSTVQAEGDQTSVHRVKPAHT